MAPSRGLSILATSIGRPTVQSFKQSRPQTFATVNSSKSPRPQPYRTPRSSNSPRTPSHAEKARIRRWRLPPLILTGVAGAAISLYITSVYISYKRDLDSVDSRNVPDDVSAIYDRTAEDFDAEVDLMERVMRIRRLRKQLAQQAYGHVLEVSAGTGRNMEFLPVLEKASPTSMPYTAINATQAQTLQGAVQTEQLRRGMRVQTVTITDKSPQMITLARLKWTKTHPWFAHALFRVQDAALPVLFPPIATADKDMQALRWGGFDTVIQTMGICSTAYPAVALMNMGLLTSPNGQVLILEHGKGYYGWLNGWLDKLAPAHAARHGCWFNKDVDKIVAESGLEVVEKRRYHFGTTYYYKLRAPSDRSLLTKRYNEEMDRLGLETQQNKNQRQVAEVAEQVSGETGSWASGLAGWWR